MGEKTMNQVAQFPQADSIDEYIKQMRAQRLAQQLDEEENVPMQYDQRGFISPAQMLARGLGQYNQKVAHDSADEQQAKAAMAKQDQIKQMFGVGQPSPQQLGSALSGQQSPQQNPLARGFGSNQQAMLIYQNNPDLYKEIAGKNLQITELQKNAAAGGQGQQYIQDFNNAGLNKTQADAEKAKWMNQNAGDTATNVMTGNQIGANRIIDNDLGDKKNAVMFNPVNGQNQVLRTDAKGMTPAQQMNPNMVEMPDNEAAAMALTILSGGKEAKQILSGNRANNPKVQQFLAQLSGGIETPQSLAEKHNLNMNTDLITNDQGQYSTKNLINQLGSAKSPTIPFNAAISHISSVEPLIDALGNGDTKAINGMTNYIKNQLGDTAVPSFDAAKKVVGDEITKAIVGGQMSQGDRQAIEETLTRANSPAQLKAVVNTYKELMAGKLGAIEQQYKAAGKDPAEFRTKYLEPESQSVINRIRPLQQSAGAQSQDARDAADWIAKNPNDPKVPAIKAHYGI